MRNVFFILLGCSLFLGRVAAGDKHERKRSVPGVLLVKFKEEIQMGGADGGEQVKALAEGVNGEVESVSKSRNTFAFRFGNEITGEAFENKLRNISSSDLVEWVEPDYYYYKGDTTPDDQYFDHLWYLNKIKAPSAWDVRKESRDVVVAVIDSGVQLDHEDIEKQIWVNTGELPGDGQDNDNNGLVDDVNGWDFYNGDNNPTADKVPVDKAPPLCIPHDSEMRYEAHGTHVAGTIGASGNNSKGITGVCWDVKVMPLKFLGGVCGSGASSSAVKAIDYAVKNGAMIINCSWGGGPFSNSLRDALLGARNAGVLVVAAAGNSSGNNDINPHYPSSYDLDNIIAVAASNKDDQRASFSCFGKNSVDLAAPGSQILSSVPKIKSDGSAVSSYSFFNGTSMATPVVSGSCALLMAECPDLSAAEVRSWLLMSVDSVQALNGVVATGGRLNLESFLKPPELPQKLQDSLSGISEVDQVNYKNSLSHVERIRLHIDPPFDEAGQEITEVEGAGASAEDNQKEQHALVFKLSPNLDLKDFAEALNKEKSLFLMDGKAAPLSEKRKTYQLLLESDPRVRTSEILRQVQKIDGVIYVEPDYQFSKGKSFTDSLREGISIIEK